MKKAETESLSSSYSSDETPPLPDEPIPETFPALNSQNPIINEYVSVEAPNSSGSPSFLSEKSNTDFLNSIKDSISPDDGWNAVLDPKTQTYYFWNSKTNETTWKNPRIPDNSSETSMKMDIQSKNVSYPSYPYKEYVFTARFNRLTGKWQNDPNKIPENFTEDARALRQQSFYFDVEATAAAHDGRSFRAERQQKRLTKKELANYKKQNRQKKEQRKREWLLED
ncbi:unnamed protein product [Pneumocystis jirovecii]|uniref:WW domain-containing protein n=1 Tax=Pneumocystis jirovecii TaxID=42068 RepID=L0P8W0_PNEJI|nr:unnamed protein product [Pneumocystis jirovecii]CCJ28519.1 unnamed protein product [Pneumocystis jirovecii]